MNDQAYPQFQSFFEMSSDDQAKWLFKDEQKIYWEHINLQDSIPSKDHALSDNDLLRVPDMKMMFCNCPFSKELHYDFSDRFYNEDYKPWW